MFGQLDCRRTNDGWMLVYRPHTGTHCQRPTTILKDKRTKSCEFDMKKCRLSIVGAGYVGLSTAIGYASKGFHVIALELDAQKAEMINKAIPILYEPWLQKSLQEAVKKNLLKCTLNLEETILNSDITFIAVGTPSKPDGSIDLEQIKKTACDIGAILKKKKTYHLVVVKSTVIPGTTENVVKPILEECSNKRCGTDFGLCMNPEFLRQGAAIHDTLNPDRIVIGENDPKSGNTLEALFADFYGEKLPPIVRTNLATAELIKYASNAFLAAKISFINTIGSICEKTPSVDVKKIAEAMGLDKRIGPAFLNAGLGYGGSCFPKDIKALIAYSHSVGYSPKLLEIIEKVNNDQASKIVETCKGFLGNLNSKRIALLGLAFKPETDDMREARSVLIINQ